MQERQGVWGVPMRDPYDSEAEYFRRAPHVAGMAAEDGRIVMNPNMAARPRSEYDAVARNEALRILFRSGRAPRPKYELTPEQSARFGAYSADPQDIRETLAARWMTGDPSAPLPDKGQGYYLNNLARLLQGM